MLFLRICDIYHNIQSFEAKPYRTTPVVDRIFANKDLFNLLRVIAEGSKISISPNVICLVTSFVVSYVAFFHFTILKASVSVAVISHLKALPLFNCKIRFYNTD